MRSLSPGDSYVSSAIASGGEFRDSQTTRFRIGNLGTDTEAVWNETVLYPNPTTDILNVSWNKNTLDTPESYIIINLLGQVIENKTIQNNEK